MNVRLKINQWTTEDDSIWDKYTGNGGGRAELLLSPCDRLSLSLSILLFSTVSLQNYTSLASQSTWFIVTRIYGDTRNSLSHALLLPLSLSNFCSFQNINIHHVLNWSWLPSSTFVNIHMPLFWIIKRKFLTSLTITLPSRCPPPRSSHSSSAWTVPCIHQRRIHILFYALVAAAAGYRFY